MKNPDLLRILFDEVARTVPAYDRAALRQLEWKYRQQWGGQRVYVTKRPRADRSESPVRDPTVVDGR
jgi:hypothetical protein